MSKYNGVTSDNPNLLQCHTESITECNNLQSSVLLAPKEALYATVCFYKQFLNFHAAH